MAFPMQMYSADRYIITAGLPLHYCTLTSLYTISN